MTNERRRKIVRTSQFKKDLRQAHKQGRNMQILEDVVDSLADDIPLQEKYRDHALKGNWKGHRECHLTPDWLLIYRKTDKGGLQLILVRAASHCNLDI